MKLRPLEDNLVLKKVEVDEETTAGGIVLPDSAKGDEEAIAEVIAVGRKIEESDKKSGQVKVGDKVIYKKYSGTNIEIEDQEYLIVKFPDCLAVIEE